MCLCFCLCACVSVCVRIYLYEITHTCIIQGSQMSTQTHILTHTHAYTCVRTILHSYMHMHMYQCATAVQQQASTRILSEIISKLSTWLQAWRLLNTRWFSLQKWSLKPLLFSVRKEVSCSVYVVKSSDVYTSSQFHSCIHLMTLLQTYKRFVKSTFVPVNRFLSHECTCERKRHGVKRKRGHPMSHGTHSIES